MNDYAANAFVGNALRGVPSKACVMPIGNRRNATAGVAYRHFTQGFGSGRCPDILFAHLKIV